MRKKPNFSLLKVVCCECGTEVLKSASFQKSCVSCQIRRRTCKVCGRITKCRRIRQGHCWPCYQASDPRLGEKHPGWKGGRISSNGYILVHAPRHPRAEKSYVREHIIVWEQNHGELLPDGWVVHHLNGVKDDNRPENLVGLSTMEHVNVLAAKAARIRELEAEITRLGGVA